MAVGIPAATCLSFPFRRLAGQSAASPGSGMDTPPDSPAGPRLVTLSEASAATGLSVDALRNQIKRGQRVAHKGNDGKVRVLLDPAEVQPPASHPSPPPDLTPLMALVTAAQDRADAAQREAARLAAELAGRDVEVRILRAEAEGQRLALGRLRARGLWARIWNRERWD